MMMMKKINSKICSIYVENAFRAKKLCVAYLEGEKKAAKANIEIIIRPTIIIILSFFLLLLLYHFGKFCKRPMRLECPMYTKNKIKWLEIATKKKYFDFIGHGSRL